MYRWSESAGRYRDPKTGRFVSESRVRAVVDSITDAASDRMTAASQRLLAGEMSVGAWQAEMQATIKLAHTSAAIIAHGGADQMTPARWGAVGRAVKDEYQYLREFAQQITDGRQPLNGRLTARAAQYGQAARGQFERIRRRDQRERGYTQERNVLAPAEHCTGCKAQTARGWVEIGTLVPVGRRQCRGNCRCRLEFRREPQEAAA